MRGLLVPVEGCGCQSKSLGEVFLPKITSSALPVFSLRQLSFVQLGTLVMQAVNLFPVLGILSERESMSCVLSA